jgi:hypothetical protein
LVPVAQASIPHSTFANSQLLIERNKIETTYCRQDKCNSFYGEWVKKICINDSLVMRVVEPTPIDDFLNYRVLIEAMLSLMVLQITTLDNESSNAILITL